jgi:hypothetical protein
MAVNGSGTEVNGGAQDAAELASLTEEGAYLPTMSSDVQISTSGLIALDTFSIYWEEFADSDTSYFDSGEMTIYKETIQDTTVNSPGLTEYGNWWSFFDSVSNDSGVVFDGIRDEDNTTVFDVTMGTSETSALEAKYSQTDYSIDDVYNALNDPENYSITGSIGTAFSSAISEALTTSRLSTKFIWNKSHQKPFKKPNETAIGIPTDDE